MSNFKSLIGLTAILSAIICELAQADTSNSCGPNCTFEYDNEKVIYKPIDASQPAIINRNILIGPRDTVIISEGITEIRPGPELGSPFNGWNQSTGTLILPSTLTHLASDATHLMKFSVIEINSKELTVEDNSFCLISDNTKLVINPDIKINGNFVYTQPDPWYSGNHFPANLMVACKGESADCQEKIADSLSWISSQNGGNVSYEQFQGYNIGNNHADYDLESKNYILYDQNNQIIGVYDSYENIIYDNVVDSYEKIDENTGRVNKFDGRGILTGQYVNRNDGSIVVYNADGKLVGLKNAKHISPAEAAALTKSTGNTVSITW